VGVKVGVGVIIKYSVKTGVKEGVTVGEAAGVSDGVKVGDGVSVSVGVLLGYSVPVVTPGSGVDSWAAAGARISAARKSITPPTYKRRTAAVDRRMA
jgi:UDP-3-O-[3-hydroxymyristoyl] glucosamine N-acyltransferase